jgi:hypothetical protein
MLECSVHICETLYSYQTDTRAWEATSNSPSVNGMEFVHRVAALACGIRKFAALGDRVLSIGTILHIDDKRLLTMHSIYSYPRTFLRLHDEHHVVDWISAYLPAHAVLAFQSATSNVAMYLKGLAILFLLVLINASPRRDVTAVIARLRISSSTTSVNWMIGHATLLAPCIYIYMHIYIYIYTYVYICILNSSLPIHYPLISRLLFLSSANDRCRPLCGMKVLLIDREA